MSSSSLSPTLLLYSFIALSSCLCFLLYCKLSGTETTYLWLSSQGFWTFLQSLSEIIIVFRLCLDKVEPITEPRPFHDHALPTNCIIIIIWLLTGIYSCCFSVTWVTCCQSKADSSLIHRTILQFLLMPIKYPGSPSQSEHSKLQSPQTLCSLLWLTINPHLLLCASIWAYLLAVEKETLACLTGDPGWWMLTFWLLLQYQVLSFFRICSRKAGHLSEIFAQIKEKKKKSKFYFAVGFKVLCICSHFVSNNPETLNNVFSFPIIQVEPRDQSPRQGQGRALFKVF